MIISFVYCVLLFMLLQAFFATSEIAAISSNLIALHNKKAKGDKKAGKIYQLITEPESFLATTLVGINLSLVLSSSFLTFFLIHLGVRNSNFWTTVLFTPFVIIFSELIPKNLGRYLRENYMLRFSWLIITFEKILSPSVALIKLMSRFLIKLFIGQVRKRSLFVTKEELKALVKEIERQGMIDKGEGSAIAGIFELKNRVIKDICVDFKKVAVINYSDSYSKIVELSKIHGFTRYPVLKNKEAVGYINIYDLFYNPGVDWHSFIRLAMRVDASHNFYDVFHRLKTNKESIALVYKGNTIVGAMTLQDIIRETVAAVVKR